MLCVWSKSTIVHMVRHIHAMHNANKAHQNEAGRSHRPVAVNLMKLQEYCCEKKFILNIFLGLYSLKKEHKIEKKKLKGKS